MAVPHSSGLPLSVRFLRRVLRAFPPTFRRAHEREIIDFVREERGSARGLGRATFWLRVTVDLARAWWRFWLRPISGPSVSFSTLRRGGIMQSILQDIRYAVRSLIRTPAWTLVVVVTLALGVGMNAAIFSVVHAVLLDPLDYEDPDQLVHVSAAYTEYDIDEGLIAGGDFENLRRVTTTLADVAGVATIRQNLTGGDRAEQVRVGWVSKNLFDVLGVPAALGRTFAEDDPMGTAMLSHELWRRSFSSDPAMIGRTVHLDDHPYVVVGVTPPNLRTEFARASTVDIWKVPDDWWQNGNIWSASGPEFGLLSLVGRAVPGVALETIREELSVIAAQTVREHAAYAASGMSYRVSDLHERIVGDMRPTLIVLTGAVSFVLLIACANVMNLLLVRAQSRRRELAVRAALGAGRRRIARLLLVESVTLAVLGGAGGILVGFLATRALPALRPPNVPRLASVAMDGPVLVFTAMIAAVCVLVFGLVPSVRAARRSVMADIRDTSVSGTRQTHRLSRTLVVTQIALSLVLLIGAGLLTRSLMRLRSVEPGFDYDNLLSFSVSLPGQRYDWPSGTDRFFRTLEERIVELPGVVAAGTVWPMPLGGGSWSGDVIGSAGDPDARTVAGYRLATPDFFATAGVRLIEGDTFGAENPKRAAIVSRALAERAWPGESAVGKRVQANPWSGAAEAFEVIGVADDVQYGNLREPVSPVIYFDSEGWSWSDWEVNLLVRTSADPTTVVGPIRDALAAMDPEIPMAQIRPMIDLVRDHLASNRFALSMIGLFALVAAVLAAVGLYGVLSYVVNQRTREIGIRIALGSERNGILRLVLGHGIRMTVLGMTAGIAGALVLTRFLTTYLFGVSATDLETYALITVGLFLVGLAACYLPARRATRLDPIRVLRSE